MYILCHIVCQFVVWIYLVSEEISVSKWGQKHLQFLGQTGDAELWRGGGTVILAALVIALVAHGLTLAWRTMLVTTMAGIVLAGMVGGSSFIGSGAAAGAVLGFAVGLGSSR